MIPTNLLMLSSTAIPVDLRFLVILTLFLSVAAFVMSGFSGYLFLKFYRDTIKPMPVLIHEVNERCISLRLLNNGNSPFFISKFSVSKNGKTSPSVAVFLPLVDEQTGYLSTSVIKENMKILPEQSIRIFEFDLSGFGSGLDLEQLREMIRQLDGLTFELSCSDIAKHFRTNIRKSISIDPSRWKA